MSDKKEKDNFSAHIGTGGTDAILSSLLRTLLLNLNIDLDRFYTMVDRYLMENHPKTSVAEMSTLRSAFIAEILNTTMTWRSFLRGLAFLKTKSVELELVIVLLDKRIIRIDHEFVIKQNGNDPEQKKILSQIYQDIIISYGYKEDVFDTLIKEYMDISKPISSEVEKHNAKCSLKRELFKDQISWKVFIKGLLILKMIKMEIKLNLKHNLNIKSSHSRIFVF